MRETPPCMLTDHPSSIASVWTQIMCARVWMVAADLGCAVEEGEMMSAHRIGCLPKLVQQREEDEDEEEQKEASSASARGKKALACRDGETCIIAVCPQTQT